jgi:N-acetylneuraminic acid mutarotase
LPPTRFLAAAAATLVTALSLTVVTSAAQAAPATKAPATKAPASQALCGKPATGAFGCFARRRTDLPPVRALTATPEGYGPADLRSAYDLPADGGAGTTVAIVDAFDDPAAETDLAAYRAQYGLPECTTENGCFRKADQRGGTDYPQADDGWAGEISLDLDMVSAVAPRAGILLVESDTNLTGDLGSAENTAVALGARYVSNSYGGYSDDPGNLAFDSAYYDHPGTVIVASAGDGGYGVSYPASSPFVTSVGGTRLVKDGSARGWSESVWNSEGVDSQGQPQWGATGSGCSAVEAKPAWQSDSGCAGRSVADVSAVADPQTGVAVYNSFSDAGWNVYGGTSASSPIIAGVYALAGAPVEGSVGASYPYDRPGALNDVTSGDDASCSSVSLCGFGTTPDCTPTYECVAGPGYDGPTGLGTPQGVDAFRAGPHGTVRGRVSDGAGGKAVAGATVTVGDYHATTGADGAYVLTLPVGGYPVSVSAFGYATRNAGAVDITDGGAVSANVTLSAIPTRTIGGAVLDGGGRGWGLYARLTVDGVPGSVTTDPRTGRYAIKVPYDATYTVHATALYPGYQVGVRPVVVKTKDVTADFALATDTGGTLAPGYRLTYHGGGLTGFDDAALPSGWTVKSSTEAGGWAFDDPLNRGNQTGGTGHFAILDDYALGWGPADSSLVSPRYDFSAEKTPQLSFRTALPPLFRLGDLTADVDVSTDDGSTWTNVWRHTDVINGPSLQTVPLTAYAGRKDVRVRFHFVGGLTGSWEIDDVAVGTRTVDTPAGGLMVGHVTDANTSSPVVGASVASAGGAGRSVDDGLYWMFAAGTGGQRVTAGLPAFGYPEVSSKATTSNNRITTADFALRPADLEVQRAVAGNVAFGTRKTVKLTVTNRGGSPATIRLGEQTADGPVVAGAGSPRARAKTSVTPLTVAGVLPGDGTAPVAGQAWRSAADLPGASYGGVAVVLSGDLYAGLGESPSGVWLDTLSRYDAATATWIPVKAPATRRFTPAYGVIRDKLYVTGGVDASGNLIPGGEVYDPRTDSWSITSAAPKAISRAGAAVAGDRLYVIGGCTTTDCGRTDVQVYDPQTDSWSAGPRYPASVAFSSCATVDDVLYCAGGVNQPNGSAPKDTAAGYRLTAGGTWQRIADAPIDFWGAASTAADGRLLTAGGVTVGADAVTNEAFAYDPGGNAWTSLPALPSPVDLASAAPGWYVLGGQTPSGVVATVSELPGYDQPHGDVPWLSVPAGPRTVPAHRSVTVNVTLDASHLGRADLGEHRAGLIIDTDTPYGSLKVPVTMTVTPPGGRPWRPPTSAKQAPSAQ